MFMAEVSQTAMAYRREVSRKTRDDVRCDPIDSPPFHTLRTVDNSLVRKGFEQLNQPKGNAS